MKKQTIKNLIFLLLTGMLLSCCSCNLSNNISGVTEQPTKEAEAPAETADKTEIPHSSSMKKLKSIWSNSDKEWTDKVSPALFETYYAEDNARKDDLYLVKIHWATEEDAHILWYLGAFFITDSMLYKSQPDKVCVCYLTAEQIYELVDPFFPVKPTGLYLRPEHFNANIFVEPAKGFLTSVE